jgi:thymidylate synthase ThyX
MISAKIITDSISPIDIRLRTFQLIYPRFIHSELMTHRVFSRNAASSRAIPIAKMIEQVETDPALPVWWGKNQPGMQAREELEYWEPKKEYFYDGHRSDWDLVYSPRDEAKNEWLRARNSAVKHAEKLLGLGAHKQIVNRLLEPWQEMQTIVTATEWTNFFNLRRHVDAQPEFKALADCMWDAMQASTPKHLKEGEWHLPYVDEASIVFEGGLTSTLEELKQWSVARCARVSYLNHDKTNPIPEKDVILASQLRTSGHFSPFEHQAMPASEDKFFANFRGWQSYRFELGF